MSFDNEILRRLQTEQLSIMKDVDAFCRKHDIKYSLYAGTLLGAVRHQGFIPWDDDLDICMPRSDYNRFISLWNKEAPDGYLLQNKDSAPGFTQSFTKIRKVNSDFYTEYDRFVARFGKPYHTGIFIDIFPVDRLPSGGIARKIYTAELMVYQLLIHEFVPEDTSWVIRTGSRMILKLISKKIRGKVRHALLKHLSRHSQDTHLNMVTTETLDAAHQIYTSDLFNQYIELPFEDSRFLCVADWNQMLRVKFGDYMLMPPEGEREWKHLPLSIDFEHGRE